MKLDITIFNPNKANLEAIVNEVKDITADPKSITPQELTTIKDTKNKLVKARTMIQRTGKETREEALKYQKDVIAYEKELIGIIEPQETRLKTIITDVADYHLRKERRKHLADNKARLTSIGDDITIMDKEILAMDTTEFDAYYNQRLADKIASDNAIKEKEAELQKAREEGAKEAEAKAKQEEKDRIAKAEQEEKDRIAKAKQDKADKLADERYQAFLKKNLYSETKQFTTVEDADNIYLYKFVDVYKK